MVAEPVMRVGTQSPVYTGENDSIYTFLEQKKSAEFQKQYRKLIIGVSGLAK
jgi:hypothetical protein